MTSPLISYTNYPKTLDSSIGTNTGVIVRPISDATIQEKKKVREIDYFTDINKLLAFAAPVAPVVPPEKKKQSWSALHRIINSGTMAAGALLVGTNWVGNTLDQIGPETIAIYGAILLANNAEVVSKGAQNLYANIANRVRPYPKVLSPNR